MNSRAKYLIKNTSLYALSEIATKMINFVLVPLYTYVLTKEQYGTVDLVFTFSTLLSPFIMLNIGEAMMRFLLDEDADDSKIRHIEFVTIAFGFAVSLIFIPIIKFIPTVKDYVWYTYAYLVFSAVREATIGYLRGKERLLQFAICNILNTVLIAGLNILFLVGLKWGIKGYLLAYIIAYAVTSVLAFLLGGQLKNYRKEKLDISLMKKMAFFSLAVIPNTMMWWITNSSDHLMVSYMKNIEENGILTVAYKIPGLLTTFSTILMQGWKYSAISEKDSTDREVFNNKILSMFFKSMLFFSAILLLLNKFFVGFLYADEYFKSWKASSFLIFGNLFLSTATFFGTSYYVEKKMVGNLLSGVVCALTNICFNVILIPKFGAMGATMAVAISYVVVMIYRYFDTKKYLRLRFWTIDNCISVLILFSILLFVNLDWMAVPFVCFALLVIINLKFIILVCKKSIFFFKRFILRINTKGGV